MGQHIVTLTALQEEGLTFVTDEANADLLERDSNAPPWTPNTYKQNQDSLQNDDYVRRMNEGMKTLIQAKVDEALAAGDDAKLQEIKDAAGVVEVVKT